MFEMLELDITNHLGTFWTSYEFWVYIYIYIYIYIYSIFLPLFKIALLYMVLDTLLMKEIVLSYIHIYYIYNIYYILYILYICVYIIYIAGRGFLHCPTLLLMTLNLMVNEAWYTHIHWRRNAVSKTYAIFDVFEKPKLNQTLKFRNIHRTYGKRTAQPWKCQNSEK